MELNVVSKEKNCLKIEIKEEDHTLCNALRKELWNDKDVDISGYQIEHSLIISPVIVVETKKKNPFKALENAADRLLKENNELKALFKKI